MCDLTRLVAQLESGSIDLLDCFSHAAHWSREDQLKLLIADQTYRARNGDPCGVEHYASLLPWLSDDAASQRELIHREFQLLLRSIPGIALLETFSTRYAAWGETLVMELRGHLASWNDRPLNRLAFDALCDDFEMGFANNQTPTIETWLQRSPNASRGDLLRELLLIETYHLAKRGMPLDWDQYRRRFPADCELIEEIQKQQEATSTAAHLATVRPSSGLDNAKDLSGSFISPQSVGDLRNGRYRFERKLGQGSFGAVYLAQDMDLMRQVAVKVPSRHSLKYPVDADSFLVEARTVASLDHPNILPVYDVGRSLDGSIYVVTKYIDGCSLAERMKKSMLDFKSVARIMEALSGALEHAHQRRLIHRDIKPANILVEENSGHVYLADFGLAIRQEEYLQKGGIAGSLVYMSPEQVLGEGHRLDGRSDLFSLGVVMYQALTGQLPFSGKSREAIIHAILTVDPPTPRTIKVAVPAELERICLKLLRKRASERYDTCRALAEDLRGWTMPRAEATSAKARRRITPRGLRSFTADDAGFFLDLLPGPRNRDGIPESIAFWKEKIEQRDPDHTFSVGLMYGPSGCGKSSLVKAGLIPQLASEVIVIYIEATPEDTEGRLLRQLQKHVPELSEDLGLAQTAERVRRSKGPKVVFILDQFEQWLHAHRVELDLDLVRALRQCDGSRLQAILMIRDDFYLAAARLMNQIDVPILTDRNFKLVDLFDREHARRVLIRFGESYDKLPLEASLQTREQQTFVHRVVDVLSENGKVVPVRLSLLADMLKGRDWKPATLESIGGLDGIGVAFLEETFAASDADARHRAHQAAVRGVLKSLLPELGTDIKGAKRSEEELLEASGYANRPHDFQDLMHILDGELRLLTPIELEGPGATPASDAPPHRFYQLTHDYLVPSLREWLTRKQRETRKGRAELRLAERASVWRVKPENKQLPTLREWLSIRLRTDSKRWSVTEKELMRTAARVHATNWGISLFAVSILCAAIAYVFQQQHQHSQERQIKLVIDSLENTSGPVIPENVNKLIELKCPEQIRWELARRFAAATELRRKMSFAFALASFGRVESDYLIAQLDSIEDEDTANLIAALGKDAAGSIAKLHKAASECKTPELQRRKACLALAALAIGDTTLPIDACEFEEGPETEVRLWFIDEFQRWQLDRKALVATVKDSPSPALRSAVCSGLSRIPADNVSRADKELIAELTSKWYSHPDSSTHIEVAWLIRQWKLREPTLPVMDSANASGPKTPPAIFNFADLGRSQSETQTAVQAWADYLGQKVEITNTLGMQLRLIPPGEFIMGGNESEQDLEALGVPIFENYSNRDERPKHQVQISRPMHVGAHEVTLRQFQEYYNADKEKHKTDAEKDGVGGYGYDGKTFEHNPSYSPWNTGWNQPVADYLDHPVVNVSWNDAVSFCKWLTAKERASGHIRADQEYRLLDEAQWEYAARGGNVGIFGFGNSTVQLTEYGNVKDSMYWDKFGGTFKHPFPDGEPLPGNDGYMFTSPVGSFAPNGFGLYDMHGNASEWCQDHFDENEYKRRRDLVKDPVGFGGMNRNGRSGPPLGGVLRNHRGGAWSSAAVLCRSAKRNKLRPIERYFDVGFRISLQSFR